MRDSDPGELDRPIRKFVFDEFLARGTPPVVEEIAPRFGLPREAAEASLDRLDAARHLKLVPGTHRILMAFPFSAVATPFVGMVPDGRRYFANCAWDSIAFHPMLRRPVRIESYCHHCSLPIRLDIDGEVRTSSTAVSPVVYLGLPAAEWWKNIVHSCSNTMLFFGSRSHMGDWRSTHPDEAGQVLSVEQVVKLSEPFYARKLELDYERPSREDVRKLFDSLGLTGPFWAV